MSDREQDVITEENTPNQPGSEIERELFGKWTIILRNLGGMLAIITMCVTSVLNGYTTHLSVSVKGEWPSEITMFITNIGLVVVAWTWVNANKTISTIMQGSDLTHRLRNRLADAISTDKKDTSAPASNDNRNS